MTDLYAIPSRPDNNNPASQSPRPLRSDQCKRIIGHCIAFAIPTILGLLMVIFLAIPAGMPPEIKLHPGSSLSSLNISSSLVTARWNIALSVKNPSKLIPVEYTHMKLRLSFDGRLALSRPYLVPAFVQGPSNVTTVRAKALSTLAIVDDLSVKGLVRALKGGVVTIDVVVKAKRRLHLGLWWVPMFDLYASCMGVTFTAPPDIKAGGDWMILGGTLSCTPDIFTQLWKLGSSSSRTIWIGHDSRPSGMASMISLISDQNSLRLTSPLPSQSTQSKKESLRQVSSCGVVSHAEVGLHEAHQLEGLMEGRPGEDAVAIEVQGGEPLVRSLLELLLVAHEGASQTYPQASPSNPKATAESLPPPDLEVMLSVHGRGVSSTPASMAKAQLDVASSSATGNDLCRGGPELRQQRAHFQRGRGGDVEIGSVHLRGQESRPDSGDSETEKIGRGSSYFPIWTFRFQRRDIFRDQRLLRSQIPENDENSFS
ncbi:hypothetical protein NL676_028974 [Syzygium grande]|nr:hypothetical protein NL676_028974 [Syzygium grande]